MRFKLSNFLYLIVFGLLIYRFRGFFFAGDREGSFDRLQDKGTDEIIKKNIILKERFASKVKEPLLLQNLANTIYERLNEVLPTYRTAQIVLELLGWNDKVQYGRFSADELTYLYACYGVREFDKLADADKYLDLFGAFAEVANPEQIAILRKMYRFTILKY